ncbi:MAG: hypothetical protein E7348_06170 [Clostridiales bacterium]|nr:hypothetical protein [Clostridiales bacterium]
MRKRLHGKIRIAIVAILCFTMLGLTACSDVPIIGDIWNGIVELTGQANPNSGVEEPITPPESEGNNPITPPEGEGNNSNTPPEGEGSNPTDPPEDDNDSSSDNNEDGDSTVSNEFTVTFVTDCDDVIANQTITSGGKVTKPKDPVKISANTDYIFDGWYNGDKLWDFENDVVEGDITLVAHWKVDSKYSDDYVIF